VCESIGGGGGAHRKMEARASAARLRQPLSPIRTPAARKQVWQQRQTTPLDRPVFWSQPPGRSTNAQTRVGVRRQLSHNGNKIAILKDLEPCFNRVH